jgi:hypothetical protein
MWHYILKDGVSEIPIDTDGENALEIIFILSIFNLEQMADEGNKK